MSDIGMKHLTLSLIPPPPLLWFSYAYAYVLYFRSILERPWANFGVFGSESCFKLVLNRLKTLLGRSTPVGGTEMVDFQGQILVFEMLKAAYDVVNQGKG